VKGDRITKKGWAKRKKKERKRESEKKKERRKKVFTTGFWR
jgi:hypothetical protein